MEQAAALRTAVAAIEAEKARVVAKFDRRLEDIRRALRAMEKGPPKPKKKPSRPK
jgi:hypothetical protein